MFRRRGSRGRGCASSRRGGSVIAMHVAYIHQHFSTRKGATGTRSYEMARALIGAGHRVTMICGVNDATAACFDVRRRVNETQIDGIDVVCIAERYGNRMGFIRRIRAFLGFARTAQRVLRDLDADLIFATSTPLTVGLPAMKASRRKRVPFVFEVRDRWPEVAIALGMLRNPLLIAYAQRMERRIYRAADRVIALSPGMKDGVCSTGYPDERVAVIPNGSDVDLFQPTTAKSTDERFGDPDDLRLVFTGAHGLANGLDAVLAAAALLQRRGEEGIRFVFIGEGGQKERLIERSRREGTAGLIRWLDSMPKDDLARVLPQLDVGLMVLKNVPAFHHGTSPNKFFDYIAAGLPVLNNYPGWLADRIRENECGIVVAPDDAEAFADAVVWMRDHRDELREMGRRGRRLAEREFARPLLAERFVGVLEGAYGADRRQ